MTGVEERSEGPDGVSEMDDLLDDLIDCSGEPNEIGRRDAGKVKTRKGTFFCAFPSTQKASLEDGRNKYEENEMSWFHSAHPDHDKCSVCGGPIAVEMDGPWSYRVCTRQGHKQSPGTGPLANAVLLFTTRGN